MKFSQLKNSIVDSFESFYLIEGDDFFMRSRAVEMLAEKIVPQFSELNLSKFSGAKAENIYQSCMVLPFGADRRLVVVSDYYPKPKEAEQLVKYSLNNIDTCTLVISNAEKSEVTKHCKNQYTFINCNREDLVIVEGWTSALFKGKDCIIDDGVSLKLAEYCAKSMTRIIIEIEKLCALNRKITLSDIDEHVVKDSEYQVYKLSNAVALKSEEAYEVLKEFESAGGYYIQTLLSNLYTLYRRMFYIKDSKLSESSISVYLGIKPYAVQMTAKTARLYSKKQLEKSMQICLDADYAIKSGRLAKEVSLKYVIAKLMS